MAGKEEVFYKKLKTQLKETTTFPTDYMYKFIVPADRNQVQEVQQIFDKGGVVVNTKKSKTGKYVSVSIIISVLTADEVIKYYRKAEKIEGIISL
ncbi:MAG: DUF493 family protein [Flavobacteriaceae bacterium]|nr:MAG: DUF493 family protein [Flavobacteriaceae bacterium]